MTGSFGPIPGLIPAQTDCSVFGPPPCIVATATPIPTSTVNASLTLARPAAGQTVRAVLTHQGSVQVNSPFTTTASIATPQTGTITLPPVPYGSYALWIKHAQHLAVSVPVTVNAPTTALTVGALLTGDVNNDNVVNLSDFSILSATFGKSSTQAGYDARADLNGDNVITIADHSLLAANFGEAGAPDPAPPPAPDALAAVSPQLSPAVVNLQGGGSVRTGRNFTVTVQAGGLGTRVDGIDAHLRFDPTRVQVVALTPGTALDQVIVSDYDNAAGTIDVALGRFGSGAVGRFAAFSVTFRAIAAGETAIRLSETLPTLLSYQGGTITPAASPLTVTVR